jgi:hypothetical protein
MIGRLLSIAALVLLAGASPASSNDLQPQHAKNIAACKEALRSGYFQLRIDFAHCVNLANGRAWINERRPHFDLMELAAAKEL